jgi:hypothetical protein
MIRKQLVDIKPVVLAFKTKNPCSTGNRGRDFDPGDDLLSHAATHAVPSALEGLTSVFGMGTGVSPPP